MSFSWKKLAIVSLCYGVGIVLAISGALFLIYRYERPSAPAKDWPATDLPTLGVRAQLRTEMRAGTVAYVYSAEPLSPKFADDFARVASDSTITKSFDISLRDKSGFQLCHAEISTLTAGLDDKGKLEGLSSEGTLFCAAHAYLDATQWGLTWNFPKLTAYPKGFVPDVPDWAKGADIEVIPAKPQTQQLTLDDLPAPPLPVDDLPAPTQTASQYAETHKPTPTQTQFGRTAH